MTNPWLVAFAATTLNYIIVVGILLWLLFDQRKQQKDASERWTKILNDLSTQFADDLRNTLMLARGVPAEAKSVPDAIYIPREPDPEERASREVSEHVLQTGMSALREEYRRIGLTRTDEQLREEVEAVASGRAPASWL